MLPDVNVAHGEHIGESMRSTRDANMTHMTFRGANMTHFEDTASINKSGVAVQCVKIYNLVSLLRCLSIAEPR